VSNESQPAGRTVEVLLVTLIEEIRGLRSDMEARTGPPGDPVIGKSSSKAKFPSCEGKRASECPWDFLEEYASFLQWKCDNPREGSEKYVKRDARDAALCMRWAMINRGKVPGPSQATAKKTFTRPAERAPEAAPTAQGDAPKTNGTTWSSGGSKWSKPATP
jgi:hypothetical protein